MAVTFPLFFNGGRVLTLAPPTPHNTTLHSPNVPTPPPQQSENSVNEGGGASTVAGAGGKSKSIAENSKVVAGGEPSREASVNMNDQMAKAQARARKWKERAMALKKDRETVVDWDDDDEPDENDLCAECGRQLPCCQWVAPAQPPSDSELTRRVSILAAEAGVVDMLPTPTNKPKVNAKDARIQDAIEAEQEQMASDQQDVTEKVLVALLSLKDENRQLNGKVKDLLRRQRALRGFMRLVKTLTIRFFVYKVFEKHSLKPLLPPPISPKSTHHTLTFVNHPTPTLPYPLL